MKQNNNNNRGIKSIFIMVRELAYLAGTIFAKGIKMPAINVRHSGGLTIVGTKKNAEVGFRSDDYLRLDSDGTISRIAGMSSYNNRAEQAIALTTLNQKFLKFIGGEGFRLNDGEKVFVLHRDKTVVLEHAVPASYGKAIIFFEGEADRPYITGIAVREDSKDSADVFAWLISKLQRLVRQPSGYFKEQQEQAIADWLLTSANEYYAEESFKAMDVIAQKTARIRKERMVPVGKTEYFVRKGGAIIKKTDLGELPVNPIHLVQNGHMSTILSALGN